MQKPKGTYDVFMDKGEKTIYLENYIKNLMKKYNYSYFRTPIFEDSNLFHRGVGETTDIVTKETYDFKDRGERNLTLRPEGTAGIVRAYIENKIYGNYPTPNKFWYYGPMFRYERPQNGRSREFYQFGIETIGSNDPAIDAEVISIAVDFYKGLGLKGIKVNINSLGDNASRINYMKALTNYFKPVLNSLCDDCKERFGKNPLRILDCKVDGNLKILKDAPKIIDYLNEESKNHFALVQKYLGVLDIPFTVNPNLVRGLDYYTNTVFEIEADIKNFGSQNVLCGGGRYNNLVKELGGPDMPAVGFALGMERLNSALEAENINLRDSKKIDVYIIPMDNKQKEKALSILKLFRNNGLEADIDYMNKSLKSNFKMADYYNARYIIIIGEDELEKDILTVKNNNTKEEYKVSSSDIIKFINDEVKK